MSSIGAPTVATRELRVLILVENMSFTYDTRVKNIAGTLTRAGYRVWVISPKYPGDPFRRVTGSVTALFYPVVQLPGGVVGHLIEYGLSLIFMAAATCFAFLVTRFDVIHICNPPDIFFPLGLMYRALGRRFVFDLHDLCPELWEARFQRSRAVSRILLALERWTVRAASHVLITSETAQERIRARTGINADRITLVRNGPDLARFPAPAPQRWSGTIDVGYIGDMNPQDGVENLLLAAHYLRHTLGCSDIRYVLIGDGHELHSLKQRAAELCLDPVVTFTGRLTHSAAMQRLSSCALCVQPDLKNPFNDSCVMVKSLEYMALGKPIVAFDLTETQNICGDAALYATGNNPHDLAGKILTLAKDAELCGRLGQIGRRRVEERFAWSISEQRLLECYRRLHHRGQTDAASIAAYDAVPAAADGEAITEAQMQPQLPPVIKIATE
jgi:glycosyltransferase involved in cell wall biosynthesis